jgi:hypothetical protein
MPYRIKNPLTYIITMLIPILLLGLLLFALYVLVGCNYTKEDGKRIPIRTFDEIRKTPELIQPLADEHILEPPIVFRWKGVDYADRYDIVINGEIIPVSLSESIDGGTTFEYVLDTPPFEMEYNWFVRAVNEFQYQPTEVLYFKFGYVDQPELISPPDEHMQILQHKPFTWTTVSEDSGYTITYEIEFSTSTDFTEPVLTTTTTETIFNPQRGALPYEQLYWRVRASNEIGVASQWTESWAYDYRNYGAPERQGLCSYCEAIHYDWYLNRIYVGGWKGNNTSYPGYTVVRWFELDPFTMVGTFANEEFAQNVHLDGIADNNKGMVYVTSQDNCFFHSYQYDTDLNDYVLANGPEGYGWVCRSGDIHSGYQDYNFGMAYSQFNQRIYVLNRRLKAIYRYVPGEVDHDLSWNIENMATLVPNWGLTVDHNTGHVFVTCAGSEPQVQVFDADGIFLHAIIPALSQQSTELTSFDMLLGAPVDVVVDNFDNLLVLLNPNGILGYTLDGYFLDSALMTKTERQELFLTPFGITVDKDNHVYTTNNTGNGHIIKLFPIHQTTP